MTIRGGLIFIAGLGLLSTACPDDAADSGSSIAPAQPLNIPEGGSERPKKLVFGFTPYLPEDQLRKEFSPLVEYLSQEIGIPTEFRFAKSYAELLALIKNYEVHVAQLSPLSYVFAKRDNPGLIILATQIADGSSTYSAYIVARDDTGFDSVQQLKGKRFGFVDRQSTSGYLYPLAYMRGLGLEPDTHFSRVLFSGNHTKLVEMVFAGEVDAGATFSTAYKMAFLDRKDARLKILAKTGRIPYDAYCASPRLDHQLVAQLRALLLRLSTRNDAGRRILGGMTNINGFVEVGDDHYDEVRRVARLVEEAGPTSP